MLNVPPIDSRCADPAFAEKYPSACRFFSRLILKNERSKSPVGQLIPFRAFVMANGAEVELTTTLQADPDCVPEVLFEDDFNTENGGSQATNYTGFTNWDLVFRPHTSFVDLIDSALIPSVVGQGLFVDLRGTGTAWFLDSEFRKKTVINFVAGETYKLSFKFAGNLRGDGGATTVQLTVGTLLAATLTPDWDDPFSTKEYTFTCLADESAKISFVTSLATSAEPDFGPLLDDVVVERLCPDSEPTTGGSSSGIEFSSSNPSVATVHSVTGVVTTIAVGKTTISAKWNNQYAYAELEVVEDCDDEPSNYLVLIDNSFSMQQNFDGVHPTKLAYAKYLAAVFFASMNTTKDQMAFGNFNVEADVNLDLTNLPEALLDSVDTLPTVHQMTDLRDAIEHGIEYLDEEATGLKVLVLMTDGQYNRGDLPGPIAREFRQRGGIIIVVGIRVFDVYFQLLNEISTKGYFLSAYGGIAEAVATNLIGLKSFLCSGDCPGGAVYGCLTEPLATQIADPSPLQVISEN